MHFLEFTQQEKTATLLMGAMILILLVTICYFLYRIHVMKKVSDEQAGKGSIDFSKDTRDLK